MKEEVSCKTLEDVSLIEVPITPDEYNEILDIQQNILNMIASRGYCTDILSQLCILAERLLPNSVASIMLVDKATGLMSVLSAPSVPQAGHDALANLKPGVGGGSCGNAVFHNEPQYVQDTFTDGRWQDIRKLAIDFNLCACWSMPIRDEDNNPIGSFALSSFEHRSPAPFHKKLLQTAASIVSMIMKNRKIEKRIKLFATAAQNAAEGMIITNKENKIIEVNQAFEDIYGYTEAEVIGHNPNIFASKKHDEKFYSDMWESIHNDSKWAGEIINKRADGSEIVQWMSVSALYDEHDKGYNYLAVFSDLTELKKSQKQVEDMAFRDSLTGLCNKTHLEQLLKSDEQKNLLLLNVNNFSYINTAYGFEVGDKLLIKLANILQNNFNANSTCRINSDEFALLFYEDIDITHTTAEIQEYFYNKEIVIDNITLNISFTYGAAHGCDYLLRNSALALKQAKESGKNNLYIFNQDADSIGHSQRESFIASNNLLHNALSEGRVIPFYQGIRNNITNEITKYEVLARIEKDGEIISPYEFLEPARLSGLLPEITKAIIDKSFNFMASNNYSFSINITEDDLSKNYLLEYLNEKELEYGIESERVILEILEGVSANGKKNHIKQLTQLKNRGYSIAIDDFGSEYSNFERVLDLDIDFLKIDAKYIKDIHKNSKSYEVTRAIVFFAKNAHIPCIAEFVHNAEVQKIIEDLGIEYSQGYHFSEPSPKLID
ncbi:diguanylate cyclase/phosphodiesterase (GGDEF/EAL) with PAS/PAC sensor(s) [Sulfurimonas gotlandica GD1]|uniref:Diguanylate cyclase/phosphodiesterase (GGDEF/EAL) with PAS/PAC sensor(S) n=1 Tax=Sulfurimonas gotlandica (strain DSM 19862 / JCM 16533 / GD1) TaxID=929558 RepID=B6BNA2_SULGG|nr:EAL domain-containing protein [Sulfurimonas gotlandica]EDZ61335.1 diguanylate cyclase/phosphodiesterase with PAS/PAC and GAF sensor [Sulfurimonas gotlandica GD1]EHP30972.1 diguanylate cyclase/phosphodiesterase (GGDEF/EAL) with PAS/PAC sensor(s) [Sulfurimonas gotlandica GD1]